MEVKPITYPTNYLSFSSLYYIVNINDYNSRGGDLEKSFLWFSIFIVTWIILNFLKINFSLAKLPYKKPLSVCPSVRHKILSGKLLLNGWMDWAEIFREFSFRCLVVHLTKIFTSKSVSHQNQKILSGQLLLNGWMD